MSRPAPGNEDVARRRGHRARSSTDGTAPVGAQPVLAPAQAEDLPDVHALFLEYAGSLGIDLSFQGFEEELRGLPGKYAAPEGALLLARLEGAACGCVALRRIDARTCEMKRLYVRPEARGRGLGRLLVERIVEEGRRRGYRAMRLDTLSTMEAAQRLYREAGFRPTPPYIFNPLEGAVFMEKEL